VRVRKSRWTVGLGDEEGGDIEAGEGVRGTGDEDIRFSGAFWNFLYSRSSY
jgi:hypothetical protein